jgi:hypothetical protein
MAIHTINIASKATPFGCLFSPRCLEGLSEVQGAGE